MINPEKCPKNDTSDQVTLQEKHVYILLICVGIFLRFYRLDTFLPTMHTVTVRYIVLLHKVLQGQHYFPRGPAMCEFDETLLTYLTLPIARLFGMHLINFRIFSALLSLSLLPSVFYFVRTLFNTRAAWIATVFISVSSWFIRSAHVYYRIRYDLGVALGLIAFALLFNSRQKPFQYGLLASILCSLSLYLQASNAVMILACIFLLLMKIVGQHRNALLMSLGYATVLITIIHFGSALHGVENSKSQHLLRFKFLSSCSEILKPRIAPQENRPAPDSSESGSQPAVKRNYPLKPPVLKFGKHRGEYIFLRNLLRSPQELVGRPLRDYFSYGYCSIVNPGIGILIAMGFLVFIVRRQNQLTRLAVLSTFTIWLCLQSIMQPNPLETHYYNVGIVVSLTLGAWLLSELIRNSYRRFKPGMVLLILLIFGLSTWEMTRTVDYMNENSRKISTEMETYQRYVCSNNDPAVFDHLPEKTHHTITQYFRILATEYPEPVSQVAVAATPVDQLNLDKYR